MIQTPPRPLIENLDTIAFPSKDFYTAPLTMHYLLCARGCTGHCTFCAYKKGHVRRRSFDNIFEEIIQVQEKYNGRYFHIIDAAFGDGVQNLAAYYHAFNDEIEKRNLSLCFSFYMRSEMVDDTVVEELQRLWDNGLDYVMIGLETGNEQDLQIYGKKASMQDNIRAVTLLNAARIPADYGFIMFNPYTTKEKLIQNIEFIKENKIFLNSNRISSRLAVYSGTPIVKMLMRDGLLLQQGNEPIYNGFNYRFEDETMQPLWNVYNDISQKIRQKSHINFHKASLTAAKVFSHLHGIDCTELLKALDTYQDCCFKFAYAMFYQVLDHYTEQGFKDDFMTVVDDHIEEITQMETDIEKMKMQVLRRTLRMRRNH